MPLTQAQLVTAVAERTQLSKSDAKRALAALDEVVLEELGNAQKVQDRRASAVDGPGEAAPEATQRPQPGDR